MNENQPNQAFERIIRPKEIKAITGLSNTTIWRMEKAGTFPKRVRLSAGEVGWLNSAVATWMASRETENL